jgi:hypothetical protein
MPRRKVETEWIEYELEQFIKYLYDKIKEKGDMSFISTHEIDGVIDEEFREWKDEVRLNNGEHTKLQELSDIMVAAFWGIISIRQAGVEW